MHLVQPIAQGQENTGQIDRNHRVPLRKRGARQKRAVRRARIGDHNITGARSGEKRGHLRLVRHICLHRTDTVAARHNRLQRVHPPTRDHHMGPRRRKAKGQVLARPRPTTGDQNAFASQCHTRITPSAFLVNRRA